MPEERYELITLFHAGALPGIPGGAHGPGTYVIDWQERVAHPADSLESYLASLAQPDESTTGEDASTTCTDGQETAQEEGVAVTRETAETPVVAPVDMPETTQESAPDNDAPMTEESPALEGA